MVLNPSFLLIGSDAKPSIGGGNAKDVEDNAVRMSLREEVSMRSRRCHWPVLGACWGTEELGWKRGSRI